MGLTELVRRVILGTAVAVSSSYSAGCISANKPFRESIEVSVEQGTTNPEGKAFAGTAREITVLNSSGSPVENVAVGLYQLDKGDVYLGKTAQSGGGIAAYSTGMTQSLQGRKQSRLEGGKTLVIRPAEGVTSFDHDSQEVVYDLTRWQAGQEYICDGIYTTEQLIEKRDSLVRLIAFFSPPGLGSAIEFVYDSVEYLVEQGILDDLEPDKKWFVLEPVNPTGYPLTIMRGVAQQIFAEATYDALNENCQDMTGGGNGKENICEEYRQRCPFKYDGETGERTDEPSFTPEDFDYCVKECVDEGRRDLEECMFIACAVETGYCDNEVQGDPQIEECAQKHGWL